MPVKTSTEKFLKTLSENATIKQAIFKRFTDDDKLALRAVDKTCNQLTKDYIDGPYQSKKSFAVATTGLYWDEAHFVKAWQLYNNTLQSKSFKPAALYKVKDWYALLKNQEINEFADGDNLGDTGRMYCPGGLHIWPVNQSWLAAQLHKGRSFELLSEVNGDVKLSETPVKYSSFAKEITAVLKADYEISDIRGYHVILSPRVEKDKINFQTIAGIEPNIEDTEKTIPIVKAAYQAHFDAIKSADKIIDLFANINLGLSDNQIQDKVASCFIGPINNKIYVQSLLRSLHKKLPSKFPDKVPDSSPQFFVPELLAWAQKLVKSKLQEQILSAKEQNDVKYTPSRPV